LFFDIDGAIIFHYTNACHQLWSSTIGRDPVAQPRVEAGMETRLHEIADGIFRLSTFVPEIAAPAGFTFNQFLVLGDEPLLFHTGPRRMFPLTRDAVARLLAHHLCEAAAELGPPLTD